MARWLAIFTLMFGLGLTAYQSFREPEGRRRPLTQGAVAQGGTGTYTLEGGSGFPSPRP